MNPSALEIYQRFVWKGEHSDLAKDLFDVPVRTMSGFIERAKKIREGYSNTGWHTEERKEEAIKAIRNANRRLGSLTPKVAESIEKLYGGTVEAGHQSIVMGGPCYVLNKAASALSLMSMGTATDLQISSIFFVADYDGVQPELINHRTPNMGQEGHLVRFPVDKEYEFSPVSAVPLPGNKWYNQVEEDIRNSYRPLMKAVEKSARIVFNERLEQALALTRWAYHNSETLGELGMRIMNRLFNIEGNLGIPLLPASDVSVRRLLSMGLELLLAKRNREKFLAAQEAARKMLLKHGFRLSIGARDGSYVPFFYECLGKDCYRARIELAYHENGQKAVLKGKCPTCGSDIEIEVDAESPDLSDYAERLSLRVDSRQIAVDTILPVVAHIGGSGETAYYAQVIPAARDLEIPFPVFVRYPRAYFNTPWSEALANALKEKDIPVLHSSDMFKTTGKISRFRKKKRYEEMNSMLEEFEIILYTSHSELHQKHANLEEQRIQGEAKDDESILVDKLMIERYLSWTYGQFTTGKLNQEGSWLWIEWALNTGFPDLFGPYFRAHVGEMMNGASYFVNFIL
ncbi:MAG: bacillithiol biosynthesis protein BshC [Candidatus Thorarchaeota archaeon]|jgi:uncharacterized protein YllA (UPF0747 family)